MGKSLHSQVEALYHNVSKAIGESRHEIKKLRQVDTKIHSDNTRATYVGVWHRIVAHARREFDLKDIQRLTTEMVASWLNIQVDKGLAPGTIATYCAAITKLQHALNNLEIRKELS